MTIDLISQQFSGAEAERERERRWRGCAVAAAACVSWGLTKPGAAAAGPGIKIRQIGGLKLLTFLILFSPPSPLSLAL